jgi:S1-C subfamily serine protease
VIAKIKQAVKQVILKTLAVAFLALGLAGISSQITAQTTTVQSASTPVAVERRPAAPQVVTVVHRLNGIKLLRMLLRSGTVGAVDTLDEAFSMTTEVHTNIIAGLALDDGETIAVWLPEAEVETDALAAYSPTSLPAIPDNFSPPVAAFPDSMQMTANATVSPELTIIGRDGKNHPAQYIGWDGITGLSVLRLPDKSLPVPARTRETPIAVKQHVRLFSPEPVSEGRSVDKAISVRISETAGTIVGLKRGLAGEINRIRMSSVKLSTANVGGIAVDDAGQTIGIVAGIEGNDAVMLPPRAIRDAARRVLARKGSVPRPWLGVSGESLAFTPFEGFVQRGWEPTRARLLMKAQNGILLTSITPGSPAEIAALRAGDVIVRVNNSEVKGTDDFSLLLESAGEQPVLFTVIRPDHPDPASITVKLSEVLDPTFTVTTFSGVGPGLSVISPFIRQGVETMPLRPAAAARRNSSGGLLVLHVRPLTPASQAGLQATDIIEAIDGQPILRTSRQLFQKLTAGSYTLSVVRNREKLTLTVAVPSP